MKITRICVSRTQLPYVDGVDGWGAGNRIEHSTATVVVIDTDTGLTGCGKFTPCDQGWRVDDAIRVVNATRDLDYVVEQPCRTHAECSLGDPIEIFS